MYEKPTRELTSTLNDAKNAADLKRYLNELKTNKDDMKLSDYLNHMIGEKRLEVADVIRRSNLSKDYAYQILSGTKTNPGRMKVVAICIGCQLDYTQTQRALEIAKKGVLYPRNAGDAIIIYNINNENWDISKINEQLDEAGQELIQ